MSGERGLTVGSERSVAEIRSEIRDAARFNVLTPGIETASTHLPELAAGLEVGQYRFGLTAFEQVFGQRHIRTKRVQLR